MAARDRGSSSSSDGGLVEQETEEPDDHNYYEPELDEEEDSELALSAPPEELWFHGMLDRKTSEERLQSSGKTGSYLVRESDRKSGLFSLSFFGRNGFSHFKITAVCGDYYIGGRQFDSLSDLIGYYTSWSLLLKDEKLEYPIPPPEPVKKIRRVIAKYSYNKTPDTDEISFIQGDVFVVDNVIDNDWLWVTLQRDKNRGLVHVSLIEEATPDLDPYAGREWFFGDISKQLAQELLMKEGTYGSFLIRPSEGSPGDYSLSLRGNSDVPRFLIKKQGSQYHLGGRVFSSVDAVVERYKTEHIVAGLSLKSPLPKPHRFWDLPNRPPMSPRVSSGGNIFSRSFGPPVLHRDEKIVNKGYLVKKGHRNRWKRLFVVLNGQEQYLYFFEHEKRTKPKDLIDLSYATVYEVHESFFGRPNCFQVVVRALNEVKITYLCADTQDLCNQWMTVVKQFCGKDRKPSSSIIDTVGVKQLRTLEVSVIEAHKLAPHRVSHPYCFVSLNQVRVSRTKIQDGITPVWNDEFKFNDIPGDINSITINLHNHNKRSKDTEIGSAIVPLSKLPKGQCVDEWYSLACSSNHKQEIGTVRVRASYTHEIIMPLDEYLCLKEVILDKDLLEVSCLGQVCKDKVALSLILLKIFRHEKKEAFLLKTMNEREIEKEDEVSTLFRGTSLATTMMDQYMKMSAIPYVQNIIKDVIHRILECKQSCEVNPARLEKGPDMVMNLKQLLDFLKEAVDTIFNSAHHCPMVLRYVFGRLQDSVKKKWCDNETVRTRVVSGFLFLRLVCPSVMNPKLCNMMSEIPSPVAARTLTLVAKCLQNLANLVEFGSKEPFMVAVNPFIYKNKERLINYIDELSSISYVPISTENVKTDFPRDLAALHDICVTHYGKLQQLSLTQPGLKRLLAVTETLTDRQRSYMEEE